MYNEFLKERPVLGHGYLHINCVINGANNSMMSLAQ